VIYSMSGLEGLGLDGQEKIMKKILAMTLGVAAVAGIALAQDHEEFQGWMKTTGGTFASLRKTVDAKQGPETAASADKLAGIFEHVKGHFEEHKAQDGIDFASTAAKSSHALAEAAKAGDWDKASAELKTIGAQCQGCHAAHREKLPDGSYKMK
jgi:cytochrome c556